MDTNAFKRYLQHLGRRRDFEKTQLHENISTKPSKYFSTGITETSGTPRRNFQPEAAAYLLKAEIINPKLRVIIDELVIDLKAAGLWDFLAYFYPFAGGTKLSHSVNLKEADKYQINWFGNVIHDENGVTFDGATGYGDTNFNPVIDGGLIMQDLMTSYYNRTPFHSGIAFGSANLFLNANWNSILNNTINMQLGNIGDTVIADPEDSIGTISGQSLVFASAWVRKVFKIFKIQGAQPLLSANFFLGAANYQASGPLLFSNGNMGMAALGTAFPFGQAGIFGWDDITQNYQEKLNRGV